MDDRSRAIYQELVRKHGSEIGRNMFNELERTGQLKPAMQRLFQHPVSTAKHQAAVLKPHAKSLLTAIDSEAEGIHKGLKSAAKRVPKGFGREGAVRMAGGALGKNIARAAPVAGGLFAVSDVADVVTNDTSFGNKAMDATAMAIGGTLGSVGGPLGTATGISLGKATSDGVQWLFGDRKTPEQRRMEEALRALQQKGLI